MKHMLCLLRMRFIHDKVLQQDTLCSEGHLPYLKGESQSSKRGFLCPI